MSHKEFMNQKMEFDVRRIPANYQVESGPTPRGQVLFKLNLLEQRANMTGTIFHLDGSITIRYTIDGRQYAGTAKPIKQ